MKARAWLARYEAELLARLESELPPVSPPPADAADKVVVHFHRFGRGHGPGGTGDLNLVAPFLRAERIA